MLNTQLLQELRDQINLLERQKHSDARDNHLLELRSICST